MRWPIMKNTTTNSSDSAKSKRENILPSAASGSIVHLYQGKPVTNSLTIAREFGRPHKNVLQSLDALISDGTIDRLEFKPVKYADAKGEQRRMIELTERGALIAMPFIGGKNSRAGQVRLVDAFIDLRAELAAQHGDDWAASRSKVAACFQLVCDTLKEVRAEQGKTTLPHHYTNEAKLINWVLFGRFEAVDREGMAQSDIKLLDQVEARDVFLIARGRTYRERKEALPAYLASLRAKQPQIGSSHA